MYSCVIVEDEFQPRKLLEQYVIRAGNLLLLGSFPDALTALAHLQTQRPDLLFLDVSLPDMSGFELLNSFPRGDRPQVILTTGYRNFAYESYEHDVVDFLKKPFLFDRFLRALTKARHSSQFFEQSEPFFVRDGHIIKQLDPQQIIYAESMDNYVKIFLANQPPITIHQTLRALEEQLPPPFLLRISRFHLVRLSAIRSIHKNEIVLMDPRKPNPIQLKMTDGYKKTVEQWLNLP